MRLSMCAISAGRCASTARYCETHKARSGTSWVTFNAETMTQAATQATHNKAPQRSVTHRYTQVTRFTQHRTSAHLRVFNLDGFKRRREVDRRRRGRSGRGGAQGHARSGARDVGALVPRAEGDFARLARDERLHAELRRDGALRAPVRANKHTATTCEKLATLAAATERRPIARKQP